MVLCAFKNTDMKEKKLPEDQKWISIYVEKPIEGQVCMSKIKGEQGYVSSCVYHNGYFETYSDESNQFVITRWKHDIWLLV